MDIKAIERLIKLMDESSVKEIEYKDSEVKLKISSRDNAPIVAAGPAFGPGLGAPAPAAAPAAADAAVAATANATAADSEEDTFITAPIVATFYSAPAPDAPAFVKVGSRVKNGETVCILEAMKLMYEITAEYDCEIEAILVSNEQRVEYGQPLFRVKKI